MSQDLLYLGPSWVPLGAGAYLNYSLRDPFVYTTSKCIQLFIKMHRNGLDMHIYIDFDDVVGTKMGPRV